MIVKVRGTVVSVGHNEIEIATSLAGTIMLTSSTIEEMSEAAMILNVPHAVTILIEIDRTRMGLPCELSTLEVPK